MAVKRKIREMIETNNKLYVIAKCIKKRNDPNFIKLLRGYYEDPHDYISILAIHGGIKYSDKVVYHIKIYETDNEKNIERNHMGFAAALYLSLIDLNFSDYFGMVPVVEWGNTATYYDSSMDNVTKNVFEYYFNPVSSINYKEVKDCRTIIEKSSRNGFFFMKHINGYDTEQDEIDKLGKVFKKYVHLNKTTRDYIEKNLKNILNNSKVLGVHVRGTDYNVGFENHPKKIAPEEYLHKAKELYMSGEYDKVFLATEDVNALELFKKEFNSKLLYYTDVFRTGNSVGPHNTPSGRSAHYYKLGLEVLRDMYTLANCDSLICGLSGVSFAARYINIALGRPFREILVLNKGINRKDSIKKK